MPKIGFIAPTQQIFDLTRKIIGEMGIARHVTLRHAALDSAVAVAKEMQDAGADVLVSRGGAAAKIANSGLIRTPLIEITITGDDLANAIEECKVLTKKSSPKITIIPFPGVNSLFRNIAPYFSTDISFLDTPANTEETERLVRQAVRNGADAIIGGASTIVARRLGIPAVTWSSGSVGITKALEEAQKVVYARQLEQERMQMLQVILSRSSEGVLTVNNSGEIQIANPAAARSLQKSGPFVGTNIRDHLPQLNLDACLRKGHHIRDQFARLGSTSLIINAHPIRVDDDVRGAIITLQPTQRITDLEKIIRQELFTKGMVATYDFKDILGDSPQMRECKKLAEEYARTSSTILINGETGTGKELFAQSIHNAGPCRGGPFVAVNCAALPPSLLESELFGYEEGAFTGAARKGKPGLFELAQNGTIFLDEISEMDRYGQTRLLRILQERCIMRLGGGSYVPLNVRVLAASNRDLPALVRAGEFREDLFYRINTLNIRLPPLREREGDIRLLAGYFLERCNLEFSKQGIFSEEALRGLEEHDWPGNIRELQNAVKRVCLSSRSVIHDVKEVAAALSSSGITTLTPNEPEKTRPTDEPEEKKRILNALQHSNGKLKPAAATLGISRGTLARRMEKLGIRRSIVY